MVRERSPQRLQAILDAALRVFGQVGFARAQIAEIAREAGVSPGTVYNYVEGKEALMLLCAERAFDPEAPLPTEFPVPASSWDETLAALESGLRTLVRLPLLEKALASERPPDDVADELRGIVEQLYEMVAVTRRGATALERSARDIPELAQAYFGRARRKLLGQLSDYIDDRVTRGLIPPVPDSTAAARFIAETVTWFARHRHGDPDAADVSDDTARDTAIELVVRALAGKAA